MSRAITITLLLGLLLVASVVLLVRPRGHASIAVTDVTQPFSASVRAPIRPFGSGAIFVLVEGHLDGEAVIEVTSNRGRDRRDIPLRGPQVSALVGGDEDWADDLQVRYRPTTAKAGQLYVALYCGVGFTPSDRERFTRIVTNRE